uniref:Uncharacterized protein n=1 Tax=Anguilla anguilla TaxID=7936 RepID=A0A0E9W1V0_ANGAN
MVCPEMTLFWAGFWVKVSSGRFTKEFIKSRQVHGSQPSAYRFTFHVN